MVLCSVKTYLMIRKISMHCPKCSSDTLIPVNCRFLWNLFNVHVRGQKIRHNRLRKQILYVLQTIPAG